MPGQAEALRIATDALPNLVTCLAFTDEWMRQPREGARILGAHLEGPYFSLAQRGAQNPAHLRTPDDGTPELLLALHPVIRVMSFAPELPGALELTERIAALGIVPAAGHSDAREEHVRRRWSVACVTLFTCGAGNLLRCAKGRGVALVCWRRRWPPTS